MRFPSARGQTTGRVHSSKKHASFANANKLSRRRAWPATESRKTGFTLLPALDGFGMRSWRSLASNPTDWIFVCMSLRSLGLADRYVRTQANIDRTTPAPRGIVTERNT
ncbi:hypothetical protein ACEPAG_6240 [Sanghuangporus baumii]